MVKLFLCKYNGCEIKKLQHFKKICIYFALAIAGLRAASKSKFPGCFLLKEG